MDIRAFDVDRFESVYPAVQSAAAQSSPSSTVESYNHTTRPATNEPLSHTMTTTTITVTAHGDTTEGHVTEWLAELLWEHKLEVFRIKGLDLFLSFFFFFIDASLRCSGLLLLSTLSINDVM
jgi:G3E family GTPase